MIDFRLNGEQVSLDVEPELPLLWAIRDEAGLTGTKFGCGIGQCGACTVQLDGRPVRGCVTPISAAAGRSVRTVEGLDPNGRHALQQAWVELNVPQCGYCQSGQLMSAASLLEAKADPSDADIDAAMAGNICRCGTYGRIRAAIHRAAEIARAQPETAPEEEGAA
jgi:aerobic-type carbon monoxide dehydrogenase small subunit (CoxS/CutS family)